MKKKKNKQHSKFCFNNFLFILFIFFLPTQFSKHFFPLFSYIDGIRIDYLSPTIYLTDVIIFFLLFLNLKSVIDFFKNKKLIFFLGLLVINIFFSKNQFLSLYKFIKIFEFLIIFSTAKDLFSKIKEKTVLIVFSFMGAIQLGLALFQLIYKQSAQGIFYFLGERLFNLSVPGIAKATINGIEFLRPYGTFSHPNSMAGFFLLLYFFVLIYKNFQRFFFLKYLNLLIFSILIFISFSKIAILSFAISNTFYLILNTKIKCFICKIARIFIPIVISFIFLQATTDPLTVEKRIELIQNSFKIIQNFPFFGVGLGGYLLVQSSFASKYRLFFNQPVHNIFLLFLSEVGFITTGFLLFQCLRTLKFFKIKNEFLFLVLTVIITGVFDHYWLTLQQNFLLLAVIYGSVSKDFFIERLSLRS